MSIEKTTNIKPDFQDIYLRLLSYAIPYKLIIAVSLVSLILLALTNAGFLSLIKQITDEGLIVKNPEATFFLPVALFSLMAIRAVTNFISSYSLRWVSRKIVEDLRNDVFKNIMLLPVRFFDKNAGGNIVSKLTYETERLSDIVIKVTLDAIRDTLTVIAVVGYMLYLDWLLTLAFLLVIPILVIYLKIISPKLRSTGKELQETMGDMTRVSEESITANKIVKIFGTALYELKRFSSYSMRNRKMHTKLAKLAGGNSFFVEIISGLALGFIVYYSLNNLTAGEFTAFATALLMLLNPIRKLTALNEHLQVGYSAALSIFEVIDETKESDQGKISRKKITGNLRFEDITFTYPNSKNLTLSKVNINIKAGEKVALVGKSGGGKSTIMNLIPRFYSCNSGKITLDEIDIKNYKLANLRDHIALVSQDIVLFNDSVRNNIAYGKKYNEKQLKAAAKAANALEFIENLEQKFDHIIGDKGVKLSGGQKQRIAIARAILKNSPILLLDEATSALDSESEKLVQKALDNLMKNRTSIIIAHRLSTVINADKIFVVHAGKIVEEGKHIDLIKLNGYYAKLYKKGFD
jgi:subfamily B ATP-binding cassette protein MsbA